MSIIETVKVKNWPPSQFTFLGEGVGKAQPYTLIAKHAKTINPDVDHYSTGNIPITFKPIRMYSVERMAVNVWVAAADENIEFFNMSGVCEFYPGSNNAVHNETILSSVTNLPSLYMTFSTHQQARANFSNQVYRPQSGVAIWNVSGDASGNSGLTSIVQ